MNKIKGLVKKIIWMLLGLMPLKNNKIVFTNFYGNGYADNPKYIAEEFKKRFQRAELIWLVKDLETVYVPEGIKKVKIYSFKMMYHMATAKFWVNNSRIDTYVRKRKKQYYMQTWHGSYGGKQSEKDAEDKLAPKYVADAKKDSELADVFLSNSEKMTKLYRDSFWYDGEICECGFPRNDILINCDTKKKNEIKENLGIPLDKKLMIYAPTFRSDGKLDKYNLDIKGCLNALSDRFGGEWISLFRIHPVIALEYEKVDIFNEMCINVSMYPDMQELLLIADVLITDYSSSYLDFTLMKKLTLFYMPDLEEYMKDRAFHYDLTDIYIPYAQSNDELFKIIEDIDMDIYNNELKGFLDWYKFLEYGDASKRAVDWISDKIVKISCCK